ncbi:terminase large subunit [Clostridia bacterium]|nr:terminase large subunit [Clostridia bacterium]
MRIDAIVSPAFEGVHRDVRRSDHLHYWLKGGRGSGKSSYISLEIISGMVRDPNRNAIIYRKVADTLRDSVFAQMVWAIRTLGWTELFQFRYRPMEIMLRPTGQRILFRGADDPVKSKGVKLSRGYFKYTWFEELSEFNGMSDIRTILDSVLRGAKRPVVFYSYNPPKSARNWVNAAALEIDPRRLIHDSDYRSMPPEWLEEAFLSEAEHVRETNERVYRNVYLGEVTGTGGAVFENVVLEPIPVELLEKFDRFHNGMDFGFAVDPDVLIRTAYDKRSSRLYLLDEFYGVRTPTETLIGRVNGLCGREIVTCDNADPRMIDTLRRGNINAQAAKKGPGSIEHGMRWLQDRAAIVIDPVRCPNAAREFTAYEYRQDRFQGLSTRSHSIELRP